MKYLLVVGFICKVYKKEPLARIYVGKKLIDEYNIPAHGDDWFNDFQQKYHMLQPNLTSEFENLYLKNIPPLKIYELEIDEKQEDVTFSIEIRNDDNNYNNGFMTKSTLIQLRIFNFIPYNLKLLSRLEKICNKNKISKNLAWYYSGRCNLFDNCLKQMTWNKKNKEEAILKNKTLSHYQVGGSGNFTCKRYKKYGIFISKLLKSYRFSMNRIDPGVGSYELKSTFNFMIDKYQQHENKRNFD